MKNRSIGSVQDLGDGKYRLRVSAGFDDFGRRVQPSKVVTAKSETDAEKQLLKLYNETRGTSSGMDKTAPKTLGELYDEFKADHVSLLRPNTQDFYSDLWETHLKSYGKTKLALITPKHIRNIIGKLPDGSRTKKAVYGMLNTMLTFASVDNGYIQANPCAKVKPPTYTAQKKRALNKKEISEIFALVQAESPERQLSFILGVACGLRRGEIMALELSDIDVGEKILRIRKAAARSRDHGDYIGKPKNESSERVLALPDAAAPVLYQIMAWHVAQADQLGDKWIDNDFVFRAWNGKRLNVEFPTHWWAEFREKHGIDQNITFHSLRHTAATHMIASNIPITTVSGVLGHSQVSTTTNIYAHLLEDTKKGAIQVMQDLLGGDM